MPDPTRETLSATQAPALFGASPYLTRWMLLRHFIHGDPIDSPEHNRMNWGKKLEPLILEQAAEELHLEVRPDQQYVRAGLVGCTRDATVICPSRGPGTLETKCVFDFATWMETWDGGKTLPRHVEIQTQQQMMVGDGAIPYQWGVLAVWCCGEVKYFERKPIPDLWEAIATEAAKFFEDVRAKREGEPFGEPIEMPLLATLFPARVGTRIDLTDKPDAAQLAEAARMMAWHAGERLGHEKGEKALRAKLKAAVGDAEEAILPDGVRVRQKNIDRAGYSVGPKTFTELKVFVPKDGTAANPENLLHAG